MELPTDIRLLQETPKGVEALSLYFQRVIPISLGAACTITAISPAGYSSGRERPSVGRGCCSSIRAFCHSAYRVAQSPAKQGFSSLFVCRCVSRLRFV